MRPHVCLEVRRLVVDLAAAVLDAGVPATPRQCPRRQRTCRDVSVTCRRDVTVTVATGRRGHVACAPPTTPATQHDAKQRAVRFCPNSRSQFFFSVSVLHDCENVSELYVYSVTTGVGKGGLAPPPNVRAKKNFLLK